jgi:glutamate racemase
VKQLFSMGCPLIVLACNTASAKALRNIQQKDLPKIAPGKRVLGVIRPTTEVVGKYSKSGHIGVLGTTGTVTSNSYPIEIEKFYPGIVVHQEACPMWVPIVENNEIESEAADIFIKKNLDNLVSQNKNIDTIILGCTHYPLLLDKIHAHLPKGITLLSQGEIVAASLREYLARHTEIESQLSKGKEIEFYTTDSPENFDKAGSRFFGQEVKSKHLGL